MTESSMVKVPLEDVYRLLNIGATVLVSAEHEGVADVMPAAWACALDLLPAKATVVVDKTHFTRPLMEKSGYFALELPTAAIARETLYLGSVSKNDESDKLEKSGAEFFTVPGYKMPMVKGCAAWMVFKIVSEPHNESTYDLFIGVCRKDLKYISANAKSAANKVDIVSFILNIDKSLNNFIPRLLHSRSQRDA